jgi:hypothetical protein
MVRLTPITLLRDSRSEHVPLSISSVSATGTSSLPSLLHNRNMPGANGAGITGMAQASVNTTRSVARGIPSPSSTALPNVVRNRQTPRLRPDDSPIGRVGISQTPARPAVMRTVSSTLGVNQRQVVPLPPIVNPFRRQVPNEQTLPIPLAKPPVPRPSPLTPQPNESVDTEMLEMNVDHTPTGTPHPAPPPPPPPPGGPPLWDRSLWRTLYSGSPDGETVGYALCRLLNDGMAGSRETLRDQVEYHARHFNHWNESHPFPTTVERALKLIACPDPRNDTVVFYEVCHKGCDYMFPVIPLAHKRKHCLFSHPACDLCKCPICGSRRFVVWKVGKARGLIKARAGGVYLGLEKSMLDITSAPGYLPKRKLFLESRKSVSEDGRPRDARWHSSPNYQKTLNHFNINSESDPKREKTTFYVGFWDGLEVARVTISYGISVFLIHPEDLLMRDIGFGPYAAPVLLTNGPKKRGHTDAHLKLFYRDMYKAAYEGFASMPGQRFVLSGLHFDRPAAQEILGLRGHNNLTGCGWCIGGTGSLGGYPRYYGYDLSSTLALIEKFSPANPLTPLVHVDRARFEEEARKAADGDKSALVKRNPAILQFAPWLDIVESATFPIGHILGHGVAKKFLQQFSGTATNPAYLKIPSYLRNMFNTLLARVQLPHDAGRGGEVFGTHRGTMTITDYVTCVTMYLPLVFSIAFHTAGLTQDDHARLDFLVYELEHLCLAVRWYYYAWAPCTDDLGNPLNTFESKSLFAGKMALAYATLVESSGFLKGLTYGLHAMAVHMTKQELERGALACCNELWGERNLKDVAGYAKGRTASHNVELTICSHMALKRRLMALEQELHVRGMLIGGKSMTGLNRAMLNASRTVIALENKLNLLRSPLPMVIQHFLLTVSGLDDSTVFYATGRLAHGEIVHGESYSRLVARTSNYVMYKQDGDYAYGSVFAFFDLGVPRAIIAPLHLERHRCRGCVVVLRMVEGVWLDVPASSIVCKMMVLCDPDDDQLLHATECLHLRVQEEY